MKFDKYFMYGVDSMGGEGNSAPQCGPGMPNGAQCRGGSYGQKSCCAHVVMMEGGGRETSFYRCLNQKVVDASFSMEIDGMKMSMGCMDNGSTYVGGAILASLGALFSMAVY